MNTFIILIEEHYGQYEVDVPYPFITSMTKLQLQDHIRAMTEAVKFYDCLDDRKKNFIKEPELKLGTYTFSIWQFDPEPRVIELEQWLKISNISQERIDGEII